MAKASSQKFIARNRAPRVQIEYDVETYGSQKKVQLPFVMGVMADLSGKPAEPLAAVADRKFLEVDVDNFDDRMKAMKPRVAYMVPNTRLSPTGSKLAATPVRRRFRVARCSCAMPGQNIWVPQYGYSAKRAWISQSILTG